MEIRNYRKMCEKLCTPECTLIEINSIKEKFRIEIKSERLFEKIDTLQYLIKVLERRDIINIENPDGLKIIAEFLNRNISLNERQNIRCNFNTQFEDIEFQQPNVPNNQGKYDYLILSTYDHLTKMVNWFSGS